MSEGEREWPYSKVAEWLDNIMGSKQGRQPMPQVKMSAARDLQDIIVEWLVLHPLSDDMRALKGGQLVENVLRAVIDGCPSDDTIQPCWDLLGLEHSSRQEIEAILQSDRGHWLKQHEIDAGYKAKPVRLYLATRRQPENMGRRTAAKKQKTKWAPGLSVALYHFLTKHVDVGRKIAAELGIEPAATEAVEAQPQTAASRDFRGAAQAASNSSFPADATSINYASILEPRSVGDLKITAGVANVTRGDTAYARFVTAWVDDVVKIQMTYESTGRTKALRDFVPYFRLPAEVNREHCIVVTGTALGGHVSEIPVRIKCSIPARLTYVQGSAKWRRNTALGDNKPTYATEHIDDSVIGPNPGPLENVFPGKRHRATITILARVAADAVKVQLLGSSGLTKNWRQDIALRSGEAARLRLSVQNKGNRPLKSLLAYCNLAEATSLVPGSTKLTKDDGSVQELPDEIVRPNDPTGNLRDEQAEDGLNIGELPVGEGLVLEWDVLFDKELAVGSIATIVGVVRPLGMNEFYNTIKVAIQR